MKLKFVLFLLVFLTPIFVLASEIDSCRDINVSGKYVLVKNLDSSDTCLNILSDNIQLDCRGYNITHVLKSGIDLNGNRSKIIIKNCHIIGRDGGTLGGIHSSFSLSNSIIYNNTFNHDSNAISLRFLDHVNISKNIINASATIFIVQAGYSKNLIFQDNILGPASGGSPIRYFQSTSTNDRFINNNMTSSYINGDILFDYPVTNIMFKSNLISVKRYSIDFESTSDVKFVNQNILRYKFKRESNITLKNSNGSIKLYNFIGKGNNLFGEPSSDIILDKNWAYVNPNISLNQSAKITLNLPKIKKAIIIKDSAICYTCSKLKYSKESYSFRTTFGGNYSIGEKQ